MYNISVVFITQAAMAQSVARRLVRRRSGVQVPWQLDENSVPSKSSKHSLAARCFCENRNFCLFIQKEKAGISSPAEKRGKSIYEKAFCFVCI